MTINSHEILKVCQRLANDKNMRVTVSQALRASLITGSGTAVGCLFLGPLGIPIGGGIGIFIAWATSEDFKSAASVIMAMPESEKARLIKSVKRIIADLDVSDAMMLLRILNGDQLLTENIVMEIARALTRQSYKIRVD